MERPRVTLGSPASPGPPTDLLLVGDEEPERDRRQLRVGLALAAAVVAGALAVGELQDHRAGQAQERRLAGVLDLSLVTANGVEQWARYDALRHTAEVDVSLQVRNDGPRGVRLLGAQLGPYALPGDVHVQPGAVADLVLRRSVDCGSPAAGDVQVEGLALSARTGDGVREVVLPVEQELPAQSLRRACGHVPLGEAVSARAADGAPRDGGLDVEVEVMAAARRPLQLAATPVLPGVSAVLLGEDGRPGPPLPWPMDDGRTLLRLRLSVTDCAAAGGAMAAPDAPLHLLLHDERGGSASPEVADARAALEGLMISACGL